jgi:hypothetical protein
MGDGDSVGFANRRYAQIGRLARLFCGSAAGGRLIGAQNEDLFSDCGNLGAFEGSHSARIWRWDIWALDAFGTGIETVSFGFGEGLPGKAWALGHPVILKDFNASGFERTAAAKAAGLTCAAALPVFAGEFLMAVVVLFCGDDETHVGAIELWHHDAGSSNDLKLADGYFGAADTFEFNARHAKFPRGYGLPGRAWRAHMPVIMHDLLNSKDFLRAKQALEIGINRGLGIPYAPGSGHTYVLTILCARNTPIARRLEVWVPNQTGDALLFHGGDCDQNTALAASTRSSRCNWTNTPRVSRCWRLPSSPNKSSRLAYQHKNRHSRGDGSLNRADGRRFHIRHLHALEYPRLARAQDRSPPAQGS